MFVSGMQDWIRVPMMVTTAIIAVPTGIKIFSWLATLWKGVLHLDTPMLWVLGFLTMFTLGGISGVVLAMVPMDIYVSDTYFIVAHIHYVLYGGSLFTIYAGVYYWFPKMTGRMFDERLGKLHFWLTFVAFNTTFGPMHLIGVKGMPRRVADYAEEFAAWNLFISLSSFVLGLSTLVFVYNMVASWRGGPRASAQPVARRSRSSGRCPRRRRSSTSTACRPSSAARTSTACRTRCTASSSPPRRRGRNNRPARPRLRPRKGLSTCRPCSSSPTRRSPARRCSTASASSAEQGARFFVVVPADAAAPRQRDLRRGRARLRAGPRGPRARVHPRPRRRRATARSATRTRSTPRWTPCAHQPIDEIIVSTLPSTSSGWLRRDLIERLEEATSLPVEHVVVDLAGEGLPFGVTLVVANLTVAAPELVERLKALADEGPRRFIAVVPQSGVQGHRVREARQRAQGACWRRWTTPGSSPPA